MLTSNVIEVTYTPNSEPVTATLDWGWFAFADVCQKLAKVICIEEKGQLWFKGILDVDPIEGESKTIKTTFDSKAAMWEALTAKERGISFIGIPVYWFDQGEFVLTPDTQKPIDAL